MIYVIVLSVFCAASRHGLHVDRESVKLHSLISHPQAQSHCNSTHPTSLFLLRCKTGKGWGVLRDIKVAQTIDSQITQILASILVIHFVDINFSPYKKTAIKPSSTKPPFRHWNNFTLISPTYQLLYTVHCNCSWHFCFYISCSGIIFHLNRLIQIIKVNW